jgi:hypothetical protein
LKVIFVDKTATEVPMFRLDFLQRASIAVLAGIVLLLGIFPGEFVSRIAGSLP